MKWSVPLSHPAYSSIELQVSDQSLSPETLDRMLPVAKGLQGTFAAADSFERGLAPHPTSFAHDLDGTRWPDAR